MSFPYCHWKHRSNNTRHHPQRLMSWVHSQNTSDNQWSTWLSNEPRKSLRGWKKKKKSNRGNALKNKEWADVKPRRVMKWCSLKSTKRGGRRPMLMKWTDADEVMPPSMEKPFPSTASPMSRQQSIPASFSQEDVHRRWSWSRFQKH